MFLLVVFTIGVVTQVATTTADSGCRNSWIAFEEHCYKHFNCSQPTGQLFTQPEAEAECVRMGGHLVSINTPEESIFVHTISRLGGGVHLSTEQPWIGLLIDFSTGSRTYNWTDGTTDIGFTWAHKQPDDSKFREECAKFFADEYNSQYSDKTLGVVNDAECDKVSSRIICERLPDVESSGPECGCPRSACLPGAVETSEGCRCLPGRTDILDTDLFGKDEHTRGTVCLSEKPCDDSAEPMSIIYVIDSSGSIGPENWPHAIKFVEAAAGMIAPSSHVGFIKYSTFVTESAWLPNGWTETDFVEAIPDQLDMGGTNTNLALDKAAEMMMSETNRRKAVILLTDGSPFSPQATLQSAENLRAAGSRLYVLGIGDLAQYDAALMKTWVENEADYFSFHDEISRLNALHMQFALGKICSSA